LTNFIYPSVRYVSVYSVVGAAAITSSVTQTISVAVIVFELTGQLNYMPYMLTGVVMAFAVSNAIGTSIYDALLKIKGLPYLPTLRQSKLYSKIGKDIMDKKWIYLTKRCTMLDCLKKMNKTLITGNRIPILRPDRTLIGDIKTSDLLKHVIYIYSL
jgi:hypothetical protein